MDYKEFVRDIHDFPKEGIVFKDISPLLANPGALHGAIEAMAQPFIHDQIDLVVGIESRGFMFGPGVAYHLGCGFAPVRKPGKLPHDTHSISYDLEYGTDTLEIHIDAIHQGSRVLIVDDLLATGGTATATKQLVEKVGGDLVGFSMVIELGFLSGRQKLGDTKFHALISY
ncbi:MAG: adenine phosphoribosyltransferase [Acidobacteriota bacterium]|nr:adenine phosphoribosyltransferase [Acidobacteriota bacterium]